jgi:hypothetical protein
VGEIAGRVRPPGAPRSNAGPVGFDYGARRIRQGGVVDRMREWLRSLPPVRAAERQAAAAAARAGGARHG